MKIKLRPHQWQQIQEILKSKNLSQPHLTSSITGIFLSIRQFFVNLICKKESSTRYTWVKLVINEQTKNSEAWIRTDALASILFSKHSLEDHEARTYAKMAKNWANLSNTNDHTPKIEEESPNPKLEEIKDPIYERNILTSQSSKNDFVIEENPITREGSPSSSPKILEKQIENANAINTITLELQEYSVAILVEHENVKLTYTLGKAKFEYLLNPNSSSFLSDLEKAKTIAQNVFEINKIEILPELGCFEYDGKNKNYCVLIGNNKIALPLNLESHILEEKDFDVIRTLVSRLNLLKRKYEKTKVLTSAKTIVLDGNFLKFTYPNVNKFVSLDLSSYAIDFKNQIRMLDAFEKANSILNEKSNRSFIEFDFTSNQTSFSFKYFVEDFLDKEEVANIHFDLNQPNNTFEEDLDVIKKLEEYNEKITFDSPRTLLKLPNETKNTEKIARAEFFKLLFKEGRTKKRFKIKGRRFFVANNLEGIFFQQEKIGSGGLAVVYKVSNLATKQILALKKTRPTLKKKEDYIQAQEGMKSSYNVLKKLNQNGRIQGIPMCPHTVTCYKGKHQTESGFMVTEFANGSDLFSWIDNNSFYKLPLLKQLELLGQILIGMEHTHEQNIVHGDLKAENILVITNNFGEPESLLISDWDGASENRSDSLSGGFTNMFVPSTFFHISKPLQEDHKKNDIFATGRLFAEVLTQRELPFEIEKHYNFSFPKPFNLNGYKSKEKISNLLKKPLPNGESLPKEMISLLNDALSSNSGLTMKNFRERYDVIVEEMKNLKKNGN